MNTRVVLLKEVDNYEEEIKLAGEVIKEGGLVAFPTETVYGLGGDALNKESSKKIYEAKGRPSDNPLIIHIAEIEDLKKIVTEIPVKATLLAEKFWPGPLTMVMKKSDIVPKETTGGLDTVAIRMPVHEVALSLIKQAGGYVAAPSANQSGRPSPTRGKYVIEDMMGRIDTILVEDDIEIGLESTIIDMTEDVPIILRPGYITKKMIEDVIGEVKFDQAIIDSDSNVAPRAPGMKYRHYAPKGRLMIVEGKEEKVVEEINRLVLVEEEHGKKVGIISSLQTKKQYTHGTIKCVGDRKNEIDITRSLYRILREFDEEDMEIIYSESFSQGELGQAIMNRLLKAAGYCVIEVE